MWATSASYKLSAMAPRRYSRYIILGFSLGTWFDHQRDIPPYILCTTGIRSSRIVSLRLCDRGSRDIGQWRLCIEVEQNNITTARKVLSGFEGLFTQLNHGRLDDLSLQLLPSGVVRDREILGPDFVQAVKARAHHDRDFFLERTFESRLWSFHMVPEILVAFLLFQLPRLLQSEWLFAACTFFQAACRDFAFTGDEIGKILLRRNMPVEHERDRLNLENVILSSFRTVESIVGEPGRENRFRAMLALRGLDFDELVGFPGTRRKRLGETIYALQRLRDATSAHGVRRRPTPVSWFEAMQAQHLAESVFHQALWHECRRAGRPEGGDEELRYLLHLMYPFREPNDWTGISRAELGNLTPIQAARQPRGLERFKDFFPTL
jgi:hypothetical protein